MPVPKIVNNVQATRPVTRQNPLSSFGNLPKPVWQKVTHSKQKSNVQNQGTEVSKDKPTQPQMNVSHASQATQGTNPVLNSTKEKTLSANNVREVVM